MENKSKRMYPSTQLVVALDPKVLKTYMWILSWSTQGSVKYYPKQFAKATKFTEEEVEKCIQALEDCKLIDIAYIDQTWVITPNAEQNQKYYQVPISKVLEGSGIKMADKVTWNVLESEKQQNSSQQSIEDMDDQQIQSMILRLQASLNERKQVEKLVKVASAPITDIDDLPF